MMCLMLWPVLLQICSVSSRSTVKGGKYLLLSEWMHSANVSVLSNSLSTIFGVSIVSNDVCSIVRCFNAVYCV